MMAELDFTALNQLAYRGLETEEERAQRDALTAQGFTIMEDGGENPFLQAAETASEPPQAPPLEPPPSAPREALKRKTEAFTNASGTRDYNRLYRAAHDYHARHKPPTVDGEYWRTHTPGEDEAPEAEQTYWMRAAKDIAQTSNDHGNDAFLMSLLNAVYAELTREYEEGIREAARRHA